MGAGGSRVLRRRVIAISNFFFLVKVKFQPARSSLTTISAGVQLDVSPPFLEISPALSVARGGGDSES